MRIALSVALMLSACGRQHPLGDGEYAFQVVEVLKDDCGLSEDPRIISSASISASGNFVSMRYRYLAGTYRSGSDDFILDGASVNVNAMLRNQDCVLETIAMHIDGETVSAREFKGALSFAFDAKRPDSCKCNYWVRFEAQR
jgi:hypothetical protein